MDEAGNSTRWEYYTSDGTLNFYLLVYYDASGKLMREEQYDPDGTLTHTETYN